MKEELSFTSTFKQCDHVSIVFKESSISFGIFKLVMIYMVCKECQNLERTQKKWKLIWL